MRFPLFVLCLTSVLSANLRSSQPARLVGLDTWTSITQEFLTSLTSSTSGLILRQLYPANYTQVEDEINTCIDRSLDRSQNYTERVINDLFSLVTACQSDQPDEVVRALLRDYQRSLAPTRCTYSVDLFGDLNDFFNAATVQGFELDAPVNFTGQLNQDSARQMVDATVTTIQAYLDATNGNRDDLVDNLGVNGTVIDQLNTDSRRFIAELDDLSEELRRGRVDEGDLQQVIRENNVVGGDVGTEMAEIYDYVRDYLEQGIDQVCSLSSSLAANIPDSSSDNS